MSNRKKPDNAASRFNHRIKLERPVLSQDSIGDTLTTWVLEDEVWADIQPRSAREIYSHHSLRPNMTHLIAIRYRDDVKADWRVVYGNRIMRLHAVINDDENNEILQLQVEESEN